jgi:hypothetical protein
MAQRSSAPNVKIIFLVVFFLEMGLALCAHRAYGPSAVSYDAVTRTGVGLDLLAGESRGRQGFIGSLYWAPLPTLLMLPLLAWPALAQTGLAASLVSAAALAGACAFLASWWAECRVARSVSVISIILLCVCPWTIWAVAGGESVLVFAFLTLAAIALTIRWLQAHSLRSLAYLAVVAALLILTRFQAALLVGAVLLLVLLYLIFQNPEKTPGLRRSYAEATIIIYLAPVVYAFLVWLAANWLIMGDATFFMRGLFPSHWPRAAQHGLLGWLEIFRDGCEWHIALVVSLLAGLVWLSSLGGRGARDEDRETRGEGLGPTSPLPRPPSPVSWAASIVALSASILIFVLSLALESPQLPTQEDKETSDILGYIVKRHAEDRVLVAGYRGYDLIRRVPEPTRAVFVHTLSFYLGTTLRDTRGKRLYLLIHRPINDSGFLAALNLENGGDRWEDIHLKYPDIFEHGVDFAVFVKGWKNWQLLEVVRTD